MGLPPRLAGKQICRRVVDESAEAMMRATLDGKGPAACATLIPGCTAERVDSVGSAVAALAAPVPGYLTLTLQTDF